MRVVEQYYGPFRCGPLESFQDRESYFSGKDMECYIQVEVNGRRLHVKQLFHREIPAKVAIRECQRKIMMEVEKEVFGG